MLGMRWVRVKRYRLTTDKCVSIREIGVSIREMGV